MKPFAKIPRACRLATFGCLIAAFVASSNAASQSSAPSSLSPAPDEILWRSSENAPLNCLYLLMRAHGISVSYTQLLAARPTKPRTLNDLSALAREFGFEVVVATGSPQALEEQNLPIIVRIYSLFWRRLAKGAICSTRQNERKDR